MNKNNQYRIDEIMDHIIEKTRLKDLFAKCEIANISKIHNIRHYQKDIKRYGVIIDAQEKNLGNRTKILIDLRLGQPIANQVFDALYDVGKDCDLKLIFYTNGYNDYDEGVPTADEYLVAGILGKLQDMNIPIFLFSIDDTDLKIEFVDMYQTWNQVNRFKSCNKPTNEAFMADLFWGVYFDSFNTAFYEPWDSFCGNYKDVKQSLYTIYIDSIFFGEIQLFWDENGVRYEIKQVSESDEYLKKVLDYELSGLQKRYGSDGVNFENVVGKLPRLHIKYSDRPFDWLYTATPRQITEFAKSMYEDAWALRWRIEERVDGLMKRESA
jgi:hypothetical protein